LTKRYLQFVAEVQDLIYKTISAENLDVVCEVLEELRQKTPRIDSGLITGIRLARDFKTAFSQSVPRFFCLLFPKGAIVGEQSFLSCCSLHPASEGLLIVSYMPDNQIYRYQPHLETQLVNRSAFI